MLRPRSLAVLARVRAVLADVAMRDAASAASSAELADRAARSRDEVLGAHDAKQARERTFANTSRGDGGTIDVASLACASAWDAAMELERQRLARDAAAAHDRATAARRELSDRQAALVRRVGERDGTSRAMRETARRALRERDDRQDDEVSEQFLGRRS